MNKALSKYLRNTVMVHINDVRCAFELCANPAEIYEVIGSIPRKFGIFQLDHIDKDSFTISNYFIEYEADQCDDETYQWYRAKDLKSKLTIQDYNKLKAARRKALTDANFSVSDDFSSFAESFKSDYYNISAILQAFRINCNNRKEVH